jgi:hypothetical protein
VSHEIKLTVKYLEKLQEWANKRVINPNMIMTKKEVREANKVDKFFASLFGTHRHKWKVGDEYYKLVFDPVWPNIKAPVKDKK